ncbi:TatD family hydrolase [Coxiella endosymbiont of Amblyomma nuttalli]|uniref:TatD family hydrolase n=1 Tax=Coxiella endosymbiont of Amblyomma nuttalli TaxID=2749996 RepID=UPI001BAA48B0|nr:TatD family hydrolase [Coxiella endosymbiont of Amblyomma nuttalli]QTS84098.1 putative deoxyribonuclease YcfH [Coxiella endosymbiont of Amblyomma nuttalli]
MFVDSHCHLNMLDLRPYEGDLGALIEKAKIEGVEHILCVSVDLVDAHTIIGIAERFKNVSASVGLHPSKKVNYEPKVQEIIELADHPKVVAVGETGLDYYYHTSRLEIMRDRFRSHIQAALQLRKPLIIHSRGAPVDTMQIMQEENAKVVGGVIHCFTESWDMSKQALKLGFYISFSGIVTFKNATNVAEIAARTPLEKMLIETDAPYIAPVPHRGKKNEPRYVRYIAEHIAKLKNITVEEIARKTTENYFNLFKSYYPSAF